MLSAFANCFKIPELRQRILFTLAMIVVVRVGVAIPVPGVNSIVLGEFFKNIVNTQTGTGALVLFNIFTGGALENCAIFALGIMPYISASIMMQLLSAVIPSMAKMAREDGGRQKITQYTRYMTIVLCLFQGYLLAVGFEHPGRNPLFQGIETIENDFGRLVPNPGFWFQFVTVLSLTSGTMLLMWLGEQITDKGIGNGISIVITVGIVAQLPTALAQAVSILFPPSSEGAGTAGVSPAVLVLLLAFLFGVIAATVAITQATRKIVVQYAKQVRGNKVYGGQSNYLPLKINYSGVMPIIFAQSILLFPSMILQFLFPTSGWAHDLGQALTDGWLYYTLYAAMIFFFSYFWVATMFNPVQIADDLKKHGGYIPGKRPGEDTAKFLDYTMTRLTLAGAVFLVVIALLPMLVSGFLNVPPIAAQFFGGTSLLIIVGVMLDTMRAMETHLLQRHYDGFLRKGRLRSRSASRAPAGSPLDSSSVVWIYFGFASLIILFIAISVYQSLLPPS
jgi:preprotein translocase subunit SecY